jgi:small-conductance mechanosensitive channel
VQGPLQSLKQLEVLVKQASESLQKLGAENRKFKDVLRRLEDENKALKDELKEVRLTLARHDRLKTRLGRLSEKLERIG